jgi:hypothetical protein
MRLELHHSINTMEADDVIEASDLLKITFMETRGEQTFVIICCFFVLAYEKLLIIVRSNSIYNNNIYIRNFRILIL